MTIKKDYRKIKSGSLKVFSSYKSVDNDDKDKYWQNKAKIISYPTRHLSAFSSVYFIKVIVKSPAKACYAEQEDHQRSDWKDKVTYQKVLEVQNTPAAQECNAAPLVEAKNAWKGCKEHEDAVYHHRRCPCKLEIVHEAYNEVFKNCSYC